MAFLFRKFALALVLGVAALVVMISGRDAEKLGDSLQIALPLFALACAATSGQTVQFFGRYLLLETAIKTPKFTLGDAAINQRPHGGSKGFPSGHTAAASFGATALVQGCLKSSPPAQAVAIMGAGFTGTSRVDAGAHTIWQVLAGAIIGWGLQFAALRRFDRWFARLIGFIGSPVRRVMPRVRRALGVAVIGALAIGMSAALTQRAQAQTGPEFSFYIGEQIAHDSNVEGNDPAGVGPFDFTAAWDGRSFQNPLHYGVRATWWRNDRFGWTLDLNHTKAYADDATLASSGFQVLEFTDGLNTFTAGPVWRWPERFGQLTPYVSAGIGIAAPHAEVQSTAAAPLTTGYQFAGPAVSWVAGLRYDFNDRWAAFGEYKGTYNWLDVDLDGGGRLETKIGTHAINFGMTYKLR